MQPVLETICWFCSKPPMRVLWYEDNGIKCHEFCEKHFRLFSDRLHLSGDSKEQVEALVVAEYLSHVE